MASKLFAFLCLLLSIQNSLAHAFETEVTVIEITDATLESISYHQQNFSGPTKIVFTNLTSVSGNVYFHQNVNLVEVDFPLLSQTGGHFYFHQNLSLERINAPQLHTVGNYFYVHGNSALSELNTCNLSNILSIDEWSSPYYHVMNNTPIVDAIPQCFSLGGPTGLALSGNTIDENMPVGSLVGTLSATSNYPAGTLTFFMEDFEADNHRFNIVGNQLLAGQVFDFETDSEYTVIVKVINQLGETQNAEFSITVQDVAVENLTVITIDDATLENIYYHQVSFPGPTKLVFPNLTSVAEMVYFHQNVNLVEVEMPQLVQTGSYFYFHQNLSLESLSVPDLTTVTGYFYIHGNSSLINLDACSLTAILPDENMEPYYHIANNTPVVDAVPQCFSLGGPENLSLSGNTVPENLAAGQIVGTLSADSNYPSGTLTYILDEYQDDNQSFSLAGNQLMTAQPFDFEANHEYTVKIKVINQLGEYTVNDFVITITDISPETISTVTIADTTLDNLYYHMEHFTTPTRLVFPNLASVGGNVYFHKNVNLVEVELPLLSQTGGCVYFHQNLSLTAVTAPSLLSIVDYLFVHGHPALEVLHVCALEEITPSQLETPYYYIYNNPMLNMADDCLSTTVVGFQPLPEVTVIPNEMLRVGTFTADTTDAVDYFFSDDAGNSVSNPDFAILGDGLYLQHEFSYYENGEYPFTVGALRLGSVAGRDASGLNEKVQLQFMLDLSTVTLSVEKQIMNTFTLYPNPASESITIASDQTVSRISIYDLGGRMVMEASNATTVNIEHLAPGIYAVQISGTDVRETQKLVIR